LHKKEIERERLRVRATERQIDREKKIKKVAEKREPDSQRGK
jgi:hypothetical protein